MGSSLGMLPESFGLLGIPEDDPAAAFLDDDILGQSANDALNMSMSMSMSTSGWPSLQDPTDDCSEYLAEDLFDSSINHYHPAIEPASNQRMMVDINGRKVSDNDVHMDVHTVDSDVEILPSPPAPPAPKKKQKTVTFKIPKSKPKSKRRKNVTAMEPKDSEVDIKCFAPVREPWIKHGMSMADVAQGYMKHQAQMLVESIAGGVDITGGRDDISEAEKFAKLEEIIHKETILAAKAMKESHEAAINEAEKKRVVRKLAIERFRAKRANRSFQKRVRYACRKQLADSRPRVKGRFVKKCEMKLYKRFGDNYRDYLFLLELEESEWMKYPASPPEDIASSSSSEDAAVPAKMKSKNKHPPVAAAASGRA